MGVHAQEKRNEEVMRVPERLEGLFSNLRMRSCVHEEHAQQHDVSGDTAGLGVVNLHTRLRSHLRALDVEEVDIMRSGMYDCPEKHCVCDLPMEPLRLVDVSPRRLLAKYSENVAAPW